MLAPHCACTTRVNALRMRHSQNCTAHAARSAQHYACASLGSAVHMRLYLHGAAHEPLAAQHCACASYGKTLRMRLSRYCTAHAPTCTDDFVCACVVFDSLCMGWAQGSLGSTIVCSRGRLESQTAPGNRREALQIRREESIAETAVQELPARPHLRLPRN